MMNEKRLKEKGQKKDFAKKGIQNLLTVNQLNDYGIFNGLKVIRNGVFILRCSVQDILNRCSVIVGMHPDQATGSLELIV